MRMAGIGNGRILVNFDENGRITDFYYPYIGMENQTSGYPIRVAIWDGKSISLDTSWKTTMTYEEGVNLVEIKWDVPNPGLEITSYNFVDTNEPIFYSILKILSKGIEGKIKLFFLHDFNIYSNPFGDTALFDPNTWSLIHYKSKRYLSIRLMSTAINSMEFSTTKGNPMDDIQDGRLDGNPISHGDVRSAAGIELNLRKNSFAKAYYVIGASRGLEEVRKLIGNVNPAQVESTFVSVYQFWKSWLSKSAWLSDHENWLYNVSLITIKNHMDINGSIIASSDFSFVNLYGDSYQYFWPRDGAIAAHALDIAGYGELAMRHFNFVKDIVSSEGYLYHKYNPNRTLASSWHPWLYNNKKILPIQEDETALEVWAMGNHFRRYKDLDELTEIYRRFVKPALHFMMRYMEDGLPKPSFDLWEERYGIHLYTISTVYGGLTQGAELAKGMGDESLAEDALDVAKTMKEQTLAKLTNGRRFIRRLDESYQPDDTVDASMYAPYFFGMLEPDHPLMVSTVEAIIQKLLINGGIARYENDMYQRRSSKPNPWIITTLWIAQYMIDLKKSDKGKELINWVVERASPSGLLPEQVDPEGFQSTSVMPLVWSHAEFIITLNKLRGKY
ncbi:glycoside hydrolase family 15 protein [Metallosphaera tengchongensis]|uniref:Glycoside hydrolase family 15 protein n=1 Tax=Metallosphaera tengchongensis TaxID=1532350 RepID=A0A6N0NS99_9CREN|nr:glycoside hydrolase family 15 protein [Metallosphaera tengchongensis]QKQ99581.1 glycoside hydrolase family 15 protein [Metallosphaera tengchongensis]